MLEETESLSFHIITPEDISQCQEVVSEAFSWEPSSIFLEPDQSIRLPWFQNFVSYFAEECCSNGLSVLCKDKTTGTIAGAFFVRDYKFPLPPNFSLDGLGQIPKTIKVLEVLEHQYDLLRPNLEVGQCVDLWILAVHPNFRRLRIADRLTALAADVAQRNGFTSAILEASGAFSARCAESAGMVKVVSVKYEDIDPIFRGMPEMHSNFTLWERVFETCS
jgi:GNAT superfamily N-acetyltransferase